MANIYTRQSNSGRVKYYSNLRINGKRIRKYLGNSLANSEIKLKKLEYDILFNSHQPKSKPKRIIAIAYISFLASIESSGVGDRQLNSIKPRLRRFVEFCESNSIKYLTDVLPAHLKTFMDIRSKENGKFNSSPISVDSLNREINVLKRFFKYVMLMQWIESNPTDVLIPYKQKSKWERYYFKSDEIKIIFENAGKFKDFFTFLLHTGLRCTDAFSLKPKHIVNGYLKLQMGKTGDNLHVPIADAIKQLLANRMENEFFFPELRTEWERTLCLRNLKQHFTIDFVRENNINLHTFRHTYAHTMLNKGVPKEVLQTLLGHRSIRTTEIYANWVRKEELERWV
jgi:site-specific recombinase XerD